MAYFKDKLERGTHSRDERIITKVTNTLRDYFSILSEKINEYNDNSSNSVINKKDIKCYLFNRYIQYEDIKDAWFLEDQLYCNSVRAIKKSSNLPPIMKHAVWQKTIIELDRIQDANPHTQ